MDWTLRKITVHYDGYTETMWLLFDQGIRHPVVLTDLEMQRLVQEYQNAKERA